MRFPISMPNTVIDSYSRLREKRLRNVWLFRMLRQTNGTFNWFWRQSTLRRHGVPRRQINTIAKAWNRVVLVIGCILVICGVGWIVWRQYDDIRNSGIESIAGKIGQYQLPIDISITSTEPVSFVGLIMLVLLIAAIFLVLCLGYVYWQNLRRHVVLKFRTVDKELQPVAEMLTHNFLKEIQQIGGLLRSQQVEGINVQLENSLALFVRSGLETRDIEELRSINELELAGFRVSIGPIMALLLRIQAKTRVQGVLELNSDNNLEVFVEWVSRGQSKTFSTDRVRVPMARKGKVNEFALGNVARELAEHAVFQLLGERLPISDRQNLGRLIEGLKASSNRNWWYAIAKYREVTDAEVTVRGKFGLGYYLIGAALLSQGEAELALGHLYRAEATGRPNAYTHYMIALALVALHYNDVQEDTRFAKEIIHHLKIAKTIDDGLAQAYHLLGIVHYQLGRRIGRSDSAQIRTSASHGDNSENSSYVKAQKYFEIALRRYQRVFDQAKSSYYESNQSATDLERIFGEMMVVTHHYADCLRSLNKFKYALSFYGDVQRSLPRQVRNLVDQALTYCLANQWGEALDHGNTHLMARNETRWLADSRIYLAWAKLGNANIKAKSLKKSSFSVTNLNSGESKALLDGFGDLDLALLLRPRFIKRRRQTNWTLVWASVSRLKSMLTEFLASKSMDSLMEVPLIDPSKYQFAYVCNSWLAWRAYSSMSPGLTEQYTHESSKFVAKESGRSSEHIWHLLEKESSPDLLQILVTIVPQMYQPKQSNANKKANSDNAIERLRVLKEKATLLLFDADIQRLAFTPGIVLRRRFLSTHAYILWRLSVGLVPDLKSWNCTKKPATLEMRWRVDFCMQVALFVSRALAESGQYKTLSRVATLSCNFLKEWIKTWQDRYDHLKEPNEVRFQFSPATIRYYWVTLECWSALSYLNLQLSQKYGLEPKDATPPYPRRKLLERLHKLDKVVSEYDHRYHPLYLYVRAKYHQACELNWKAIEDLLTLLSVTEMFGTPSASPLEVQAGSNRDDVPQSEMALHEQEQRTQLLYLERVCGQQQFGYFVDAPRIHGELSECFASLNEEQSSVEHLLFALTKSSYLDLDVEYFARLSRRLIELERFDEALTIVREASGRVGQLGQDSIRTSLVVSLDTMECILLTRLGKHHESLELGLPLAQHSKSPVRSAKGPFQHALDELQRRRSALNEVTPKDPYDITANDISSQWEKLLASHERLPFLDWSKLMLQMAAIRESVSNKVDSIDEIDLSDSLGSSVYTLISTYLDGLRYEPGMLPTMRRYDEHKLFLSVIDHAELQVARGAYMLVLHACELYNNIAYNFARLGVSLKESMRYANTAIAVTTALTCMAKSAYEKGGETISELVSDLEDRLAMYYDSLAWIFYRGVEENSSNNKKDIDTSIKLLKEQAVVLNKRYAIIHYHLARAYLLRTEALWQKTIKTPVSISDIADSVRLDLGQARHHLRIATNLDTHHRLRQEITLYHQRIDEAIEIWRAAHVYEPYGDFKSGDDSVDLANKIKI